jgi:transposase
MRRRIRLLIVFFNDNATLIHTMPSTKTSRRQHSPATKNLFVGAVLGGQDVAQAARHFGLKDSTARSILKKYHETGTTENQTRSGRPPKLTEADKRQIVRTARKERRTPFSKIGNQLGLNVTDTTIRHVLSSAGYHRRVARKVPFLTKLHRHARMAWARRYRAYKHCDWSKVIWSDEAYIYLGDDRGRVFVTRRADEEYHEECLVPTFKQSPVRVMVWACIMEGRKGPLVVLEYPGGKGGGMNTERYCKQVLEGVLEDFYVEMTKVHGSVEFQQDNASCHTSKRTKNWLTDHGISLLYHPPNSPDLSPIEPVWHELKKIIRSCPHPPTSVDKLKAAVHTAWDELDVADINKYIFSMPDRVAAINNAKGGHTRF